MKYAFALKILGWNKIYTTANFNVSPLTDGIYGPILDKNTGTKGVLAADYYPLLDSEMLKYEVEIDPVTQEIMSNPASFRLYGDEDLIAEVVEISGDRAEVSVDISDTGTPNITVASRGDTFSSGAQLIRIGQETWKVSSRIGNTFFTSERGLYGSFQERSIVTPQNPVYLTPNTIGQAGRGVELWLQVFDSAGNISSLTTVWTGFVEYCRLSDNNFVEIVCRDSFSYLKNNSANIHMIAPRVAKSAGYDVSLITWQFEKDIHTSGLTPIIHYVRDFTSTTAAEYYNYTNIPLDSVVRKFGDSMETHLRSHGGAWADVRSILQRINYDAEKATLKFYTRRSITDWTDGSKLSYWLGDRAGDQDAVEYSIGPTGPYYFSFSGDNAYSEIKLSFKGNKFRTLQMIRESETDSQQIKVTVDNPYNDNMMDYLAGAGGSMATALFNNIAKTQAKIPDANKIYDDIDTQHIWMKLRGRYPNTSTENQITTIYGIVEMDAISYVPSRRTDYAFDIEEGFDWEYGNLVESQDYVKGLYYGYWIPYSRFFDTNIATLCADVVLPIEVVSPMFRRFDVPSNKKTLGEELADHMKFFDYYFTPDAQGKITVKNFADNLANTTPDITITSDDLLEKPEFSQDSALVNQVTIKSNGFQNSNNSDNLIDYASIKNYGGKKSKEIDLSGTIFELRYFSNRDKFNNILSERYLRRFAGIRNVVTVKLPITFYTAEIGDCVQLTDWITPNQSGVIGGAGELYTLIKKEVNWSEAIVTLTLLLFPFYKFEQGNIIPCARVESITGPDLTITNDYIDTYSTMSDYSFSTATSYPFTSGDRGIGHFATGYKVVLTNRNDAEWYQEEFSVSSVDPVTFTITLATSPGAYWTTAIDNGEIVDIHYSVADNVATLQYPYTYIGNASTGYVNTAQTNPNKKWRAS